ncbi:MAG: glycosyltransferase, partial [Bacteroidales bacterium]|nr:glycosyltransferase [Bacteroidales bacterium]
MNYSKEISIVVSLFNEAESLPELVSWIHEALDGKFTYDIIMVNDGSTDASWKVIEELAGKDETIRALSFRRNYGKSAALY